MEPDFYSLKYQIKIFHSTIFPLQTATAIKYLSVYRFPDTLQSALTLLVSAGIRTSLSHTVLSVHLKLHVLRRNLHFLLYLQTLEQNLPFQLLPFFCVTSSPFALKLRQNTTVGVFAVILANPPIPANAPGPL